MREVYAKKLWEVTGMGLDSFPGHLYTPDMPGIKRYKLKLFWWTLDTENLLFFPSNQIDSFKGQFFTSYYHYLFIFIGLENLNVIFNPNANIQFISLSQQLLF